jgi:hypothetical protein
MDINILPGVTGRAAAVDGGALLPARAVLDRYGIVGRTLARWLESEKLNFPRPTVINKRRYFRERELVDWERARVADKAQAVA